MTRSHKNLSPYDTYVSSSHQFVLLADVIPNSGTETYLRQLLEVMTSIGAVYETHVFVGGSSEHEFSPERLQVPVEIHHLRTHGAGAFIEITLTINRLLRRMKRECILVVSAGTPGLFLLGPPKFRRMVYLLHTYPHGIKNRFWGPIFGWLASFRWNLVTVSEFARDVISEYWFLGTRAQEIKVVHTGIKPLEKVSSEDPDSQSPPAKLRILCVASCEWFKNPWLWTEIAEKTNEAAPGMFEFIWVGGGTLYPRLQNFCVMNNISHFVKFVGPVQDPTDFFRSASIYLQLSEVESLGISVIEAARAGIPAVVSNAGGLPEVVRDGITGFVCSRGSSTEIVERLVFLGQHEKKRILMGRSAKRHYEERFSYDTWSKRMTTQLL